MKPEFDEYGVSEDVLAELQHKWETKMLASHVAEFEITAASQQAPPAPHRHYSSHPLMPHYPSHTSYGVLPAPGQSTVKSEPVDSRFILNGPQGMPAYALPPLPGPQIPGAPRSVGSQPAIPYPPLPSTARTAYTPQPAPSTTPQLPQPQRIPQVDGPSSSESDTPSPPPSHPAYAPHSQHPSLPQPSQPSQSSSRPDDSEAINSDLDDSDSEEEEEAQEEGPGDGDIVFCTYDKVARVKNKWKCILKDGMIHVNGKDYLFAKCTGEFEW